MSYANNSMYCKSFGHSPPYICNFITILIEAHEGSKRVKRCIDGRRHKRGHVSLGKGGCARLLIFRRAATCYIVELISSLEITGLFGIRIQTKTTPNLICRFEVIQELLYHVQDTSGICLVENIFIKYTSRCRRH